MGPYSDILPRLDLSCYGPPASNWDRGTLKEIIEGCPPCGSTRCQPRPCVPVDSCGQMCCPPPCKESSCRLPPIDCCQPSPCRETCDVQREPCRLPPINNFSNGRICENHPRDDCCMVPKCCPPRLPECPVGFCVERVRPMKPETCYEPPSQPFDGCSLYRTQFRGCPGAPAASYKPSSSFDPPCARMANLTTYRDNYTCKPICLERPEHKSDYSPPCAPFEGCTTYRVDYRGCYGSPALSVKPRSMFDPSTARMEGCTTYKCNYIPYCPAELAYARGKPQKPAEESSFSCAPFNGCSTYRMDFVPKCCTKANSLKPNSTTGFSSAPFSGCTTYKNDYLPFYFRNCCPDPCQPRECCMPRCCP